ncbi:MAG: IclR family transcriptional regulator, acetate operon repressor [Halanaerobiales bacterium]|nr:IclR family transcriptional regulator, acetate operon repressor [Halanaerobiales bacterium]
MKERNIVQSVVKAMKIFEELAYNGAPLSLSRLSQRVDMNISTVHRLINTLVKLGYVMQNTEGYYCLGMHAYETADIINHNFDLRELVRPYLEEIQASCNETTNLVVLEDNQVVYLDQVESTKMVRMFASVGSKGPAYSTGSGKVLLSYLSKKDLEEYINKTNFIKYTENTIVDPEKLKEELAEIRKRGYALDFEEMEKGVCCVAVPVIGKGGRLLGAISVSGPATRMTKEYMDQVLIPLVKGKAAEIRLKLEKGYRPINK